MIDRSSLDLTREQATALEGMPLSAAWSMAAEALDQLAAQVETLPQMQGLTLTERMAIRTGVELAALTLRNSAEDVLAAQVLPD